MKKALAMLLFAGLAFLPMASFADVVDESLGQGAGFEAALNTGSSDLIQIFPQKAEDFASAVFYRYEYPDYGAYVSGYNDIGQVGGSDNWMGIVDKKLGIGTLGVFTNVPVNYFTNDAGGHPDLGLEYQSGDNTWNDMGYGATTNDWASIVNSWHARLPVDWTTGPVGWWNPPEALMYALGPVYFATPQNKIQVVYADQGFGLSLNYGDTQGANRSDITKNTYTDGDGDNVGAASDLGWKKYSDAAMEFGGKVGYGTKDSGVFSNLDVAGSFELGTIDVTRTRIQENPAVNGANVSSNISLKDGNGGIYDARLALLATKDTDETTQIRLSAEGVLSKLGTEFLYQVDGDNDGDFTDAADLSVKRDSSYDNLNILVNAGVVEKIEGGNGRVVASLGVNFRDQALKDKQMVYDPADSRYEFFFLSWISDVSGQILQVPVRVGVEQALTGWLTLRLGASTNAFRYAWGKAVVSSDLKADRTGFNDTATINTATDAFQNVDFNTGLGVALGNFTFDMLLDQEWVEDTLVQDVRPGRGTFIYGDLASVAKFQATFKY